MGVFKRIRKGKEGKETPYWYIRYSVHGKIKWESIGKVGSVTKDNARAKLAERKKQIRLGQLDMIENDIPTLEEFTIDYLVYQRDVKQKRSWGKDEAHMKRFNSIFGERKLSDINVKDIDDYKLNRLKEVKPATVNRELSVLRHLLFLAKKWKKFFSDNPVSESGLLTEHNLKERILKPEEEERLLSCSANHLKPILITALNTGMRKGEVLSLKWADIDLEQNLILVRHTVSKSKKPRLIPISSALRRLLVEQKLKTSWNDYVFLNPEGNPYLRPDALKRCFEGACRRANIVGLRFHDLRHTAATRMIERGANIVAVSKILGHADIKTTMRYAHPEDSLKEAVEKLSAIND